MPHEEQNDALKRNNKIAIERYKFAIECFKEHKKVIADLGCGMGYGTQLLKDAGHIVEGFDNNEDAIEYARKNYPGVYNIEDLEEKPFYNFDAGVCLEALCHLKDPKKFIDNNNIKEMVVSAPIDPNPDDGYFYRLHNFSEKQFKNLFKDWEIVNEKWQGNKQKYLIIHIKRK